ncbi:MAG: TetR/AcrR family transcriptional regulator, partial [Bradymonadaceae bacterium]
MSDFAPRKKPQQERSRRTYDAIVETATDLLVEDGYHNMSTNKIAECADVSVGSIYQYFPNKEAIVLAVIENFAERQYEILADGLEQVQGIQLDEAIRKLVDNMLQAKRDDPELSRVLFEQLPPIGQHDVMHEWTERAADL